MIGDTSYANLKVSGYQPSKAVQDITKCVRDAFSAGQDILDKDWPELNDLSVIDRMNRDQRTFNAFVDESIEDPAEAWKWRGTRSKARNKAIAMHANLTAGYIISMFMAQNESSEEDRDFSDSMRDLAEWMVQNSNYKSSFLMATMGMLVNPVTYLGAEYAEVFQTIKVKAAKGYDKQEILDEVLSGFQAPVYSADQILISNAHEQNIQRQHRLIKRRYIEYSEAQAKYKDCEYFEYVQPGIRSVYNDITGVFYDIKDDAHPNLVEESVYLCRRDDSEIPFVGGIYMGVDDVEANPIRHRDNRGAPKYNFVPFGYQRVNEHFYFYKSLMNSQYWDNQLLDAQYEVGMNRLFLDTNMPIAVSGAEGVNSDIVFPGAVTAFENPEAKATAVLPQADISKIFAGINMVEKSMEEGSISDLSSGQLPPAGTLAASVATAQQNAKTLLQGVGKTLAESIVQYGGLMADIALQHLTIPQVEELIGDNAKLKYRSFILKNKVVDGKQVSKVLRFDESLLGAEMTVKQKEMESLKLLEKSGYPNNKEEIYRINPELFSRMKYLTFVEPQRMFPKNEEFMQAMHMELMKQMEGNPYVSLEALTRSTLYQFFRGNTEEYMQKPPTQPQGPVQTDPTAIAKGNMVGNMVSQKALGAGLAGMGGR